MTSTLTKMMRHVAQDQQRLKDFEAQRRQEQLQSLGLTTDAAMPLIDVLNKLDALPGDRNGRKIRVSLEGKAPGILGIAISHTTASDEFNISPELGQRRSITFLIDEKRRSFSATRHDIRHAQADTYGSTSVGKTCYTCLISLAQWCGKHLDQQQMDMAEEFFDQAEAAMSDNTPNGNGAPGPARRTP